MKKKIIIFLNGLRGIHCLEKILSNEYNVLSVITPENFFNSNFLHLKEKYKFKHIKTDNVNKGEVIENLKKFKSKVFPRFLVKIYF